MKQLSKSLLWGSLVFFAAGYLLVLVGKSQTIRSDRRPFSVVNQAGAIMVVIYANRTAQGLVGSTVFYGENRNVVAVLAGHNGLKIKEFGK